MIPECRNGNEMYIEQRRGKNNSDEGSNNNCAIYNTNKSLKRFEFIEKNTNLTFGLFVTFAPCVYIFLVPLAFSMRYLSKYFSHRSCVSMFNMDFTNSWCAPYEKVFSAVGEKRMKETWATDDTAARS